MYNFLFEDLVATLLGVFLAVQLLGQMVTMLFEELSPIFNRVTVIFVHRF